jgi:tRNA (cytidine/uridine-2'-O-)-methyltransferase
VRVHDSWSQFIDTERPEHLFFFSKHATRPYNQASFSNTSHLVFGNETQGLPSELHTEYRESFYLVPMRTHIVRSLNLAQCAAVAMYEALRQQNFDHIAHS